MSEVEIRQSRLGKRPIDLPKGVTVNISADVVDVQGPKGKVKRAIPTGVIAKKDGESILVTADAVGKDHARLQGLGRALIAAMVKGAAEGYERTLELHGTGYRCELKGRTIHFNLSLSHPATFDLPQGIDAEVPKDSKGTVLILRSADKEAIGQAGASIKSLRPPEPYGGKGIRFRGEQIRRKAGKAGKGRK
ncbi:MAG: 50S ribosomal protein L6 [Polyangiaceae bacterium]|nr:50S ribosomal protein L6 [Polyangiaceae bacterium]